MAKNKKNWAMLGLIGGVCAAPFTGGASLFWSAAACGGIGLVAGNVVEAALGDDKEDGKQANQQANLALEANASKEIKEELKRLREDLDKEKNRKKEAEDGIKQYEDIKNDPNSTKEEKEQAEKMIQFFQTQLDDSGQKTKNLEKKIEDLLKDLPRGNTGNSLPDLLEMKTSIKVVIAGATVLLVYLMFIREDNKK